MTTRSLPITAPERMIDLANELGSWTRDFDGSKVPPSAPPVGDITCEILDRAGSVLLTAAREKGAAIRCLEKIRDIGLGPDRPSAQSQADLAAEIAKEAILILSGQQQDDPAARMVNRLENAARAYERLDKLTRDDAKTRAQRKAIIAEMAEARREILAFMGGRR